VTVTCCGLAIYVMIRDVLCETVAAVIFLHVHLMLLVFRMLRVCFCTILMAILITKFYVPNLLVQTYLR